MKTKYMTLGAALLKEMGLKGWKMKAVSNSEFRAGGYPDDTLGYADSTAKVIGISDALLKSGCCSANIMDTILHEIAHAVTDTIHGLHTAPHGKHWKATARALGAADHMNGLDCGCPTYA